MPRVYQLPELLIRGTIASQTMAKRLKELSPAELQSFNDLYTKILGDPELKSAQGKLTRDLRNTIGCEYSESPAAAKQEFRFVVWKSLVYALYHCEYSFKCRHCGATKYKAKSGRMTAINKEVAICPACNHAEYNGSFYPYHAIAHLPTISPIAAVQGKPKLTQAEIQALINNPKATAKLVRRFTAGYIAQILRENKIKYEGKHTEGTAFADIACKDELLGLLDTYSIKYTTVTSSSTIHTEQSLELAPIRFTAAYCALKARYAQYTITIEDSSGAPTTMLRIKAPAITPLITTTVTTYSPILILNQPSNNNLDEDPNASDNYYTIEFSKFYMDGQRRVDPNMRTETSELLNTIRTNLGDGYPKRVFDMITDGYYVPTTERPDWEAFALIHRDALKTILRNKGTEVNHKKIATILGISTRSVHEILTNMRVIGTSICGYDYARPETRYE